MELSARERLDIGTELRGAADAIAAGNDGKARVCARRASGVALRAWYRSRGSAAAPTDAQSLLKLAASDDAFPAAGREAAARLSESVSGRSGDSQPAGSHPAAGAARAGSPFTTDPVADAHIVITAVESSSPGATGPGPSADRDV